MSFATAFAFTGPGGPYTDSEGAPQQAPANNPRFDHAADGTPLGLLIADPPTLSAPEQVMLNAGLVANQAVTVLHRYTQPDGTEVAQATWTRRPAEAVAQLLGLPGWHQSLIMVARTLPVADGQVTFRGVVYQVVSGLLSQRRPETSQWLVRCPVVPSAWYVNLLNALVVTPLALAGAWAAADAIYVLCGDPSLGAAGAAVSLLELTGRQAPAVAVNQPTFVPGLHWAGDGLTSYIDTGLNLSTLARYSLNNAALAMYQTTDLPGASYLVGVAQSGGPTTRTALRGRNGLSCSGFINDNTVASLAGVASGAGFLVASRTDAETVFSGKGGDGYTVFGIPSVQVPNNHTLTIGKLGGGSTYDPNGCAFLYVGRLTMAQADVVQQAVTSFLLAIGAISSDTEPNPITYSYGCFEQAELAQVVPAGLIVTQQAPPPQLPTDSSADCPYLPMTISSTQQVGAIVSSTRTDIAGEHFIWGDRPVAPVGAVGSYPNVRPNQGSPTIYSQTSKRECRYQISALQKAFTSWLIKQRYSAGALPRGDSRYPDGGWLDIADAAGFNTAPWAGVAGANLTTDVAIDTGGSAGAGNAIVHHAQIAANPDSYFERIVQSYACSMDLVYLPTARLCDSASMPQYGFLLDAELQTDIAPADWLAFVQRAAASCHATGHKLTVYNNALNGGGAKATGFSTSNIDDIAAAADWLGVLLYNGNVEKSVQQSWADQIAMFQRAVPWSKLYPIVGIGAPGQEMAVADALWINSIMVANGVRRVMFWRDSAAQGGPPTTRANQVMAAVMGLTTADPTGVLDQFDFDSGATLG